MENETMGRLIAAKRKELGLTQQELAAKMGVTDKAVSKWERDLSCPDVGTLPRLAQIFGLSTDELLQARPGRAERKGAAPTVSLICKAVCLALGVAVVVLSLLGELDTDPALVMLGLGLAAAGVALLEKK